MKALYTLCLLVSILVTPVLAHENEVFKHGSTGTCYGWAILDNGMRLCFSNPEQTKGRYLIYNHGIWHVSEERPIPTPKENK